MKFKDSKMRCLICREEAYLFKKGNIKEISSDDLKITDAQYGKHWQLWECKNCKVIFSYPMPNKSYLVELYRNMKDANYNSEEKGRKKNFKRILEEIEKIASGKGRLLDIGAASGMLIELAINKGWQAEGIEVSEELCKEGARKNLKIYNYSLEDFEINEKYEVITAIDIIEHLAFPELLLKKSHNWLEKDGILCIVTPDIGSFAAKLLGNHWWHCRPPHLYYFNKNSISYLLKKNNFEIIKIRNYIWHFSLAYLLSRFKIKIESNALRSIIIPLNLRDSIEIYARRI